MGPLLASILSESPAISHEDMRTPPRFSQTPGVDLKVLQHVIASVGQNKEPLQHVAQDQSGFRTNITSTMNAPLDHRAQVNEV